jgi:hypothetical protein
LSRSYHRQQQQQLAAAAVSAEATVAVDWPGNSSKGSSSAADQASSAADGAAQATSDVAATLRAALSDAAGRVGVLHLVLHSTQWGLVGGWTQQVAAVVEPGELLWLLQPAGCYIFALLLPRICALLRPVPMHTREVGARTTKPVTACCTADGCHAGAAAAELLSFLGVDPGSSSLGQLVASQGPLLPTPDGGMVAVLGQQQLLAPAPVIKQQQQQSMQRSSGCAGSGWQMQQMFGGGGAFLTSWVLQLTQPDGHRLLGVEELYPLLSQLQQLIVVSSSWLPDGVTHVLLRGGVAAVVAATDAAAVEELEAADVAEFFTVFYDRLLQAGLDVLQALQSAAAAVPAVGSGVYECYQL